MTKKAKRLTESNTKSGKGKRHQHYRYEVTIAPAFPGAPMYALEL